MFCPFKFNDKTLGYKSEPHILACQCEKEQCALWEWVTGTCALATIAVLRGRDIALQEERRKKGTYKTT